MRLLLAGIAIVCITGPAYAQRCPAGQDQFHNCLSMDPQMRARQEQWANQPAARQIPGARPRNECVHRYLSKRYGDPRFTRLVAEAKRRGLGGGVEEARKMSGERDYISLQNEAFAHCKGQR